MTYHLELVYTKQIWEYWRSFLIGFAAYMNNSKTCKPCLSPEKTYIGYHRCICWIDAFLKRKKYGCWHQADRYGCLAFFHMSTGTQTWDFEQLSLQPTKCLGISSTSWRPKKHPNILNLSQGMNHRKFTVDKHGLCVRKIGMSIWISPHDVYWNAWWLGDPPWLKEPPNGSNFCMEIGSMAGTTEH